MKAWNWICGLIPKMVSNNIVLHFFEFLRIVQKLLKWNGAKNLPKNIISFETHIETIRESNGYIEDQHNYKDMQYGKATMYGCGCEVFAVYNALHSLSSLIPVSLPNLISRFEQDGMVLGGRFGTSPKALLNYFKEKGFYVKLTAEEKDFDLFGDEFDSFILTIYNDRNDIRREVHTINISKENGIFTAHNVCCNGQAEKPHSSVTELISHINGGKAEGISLIGIRKVQHGISF